MKRMLSNYQAKYYNTDEFVVYNRYFDNIFYLCEEEYKINKNIINVLYQTNIPSPYRVDFFNELGKKCNLTVLFERESSSERDSAWHNHNFKNFNAVFLDGFKIKTNTALCFNISKYLKKGLFDIFVIGGYSTPTGMLSIQILNNRKIPFILNTDGGLIKNDNILRHKIKSYFISSAKYWLSTGKETTKYLNHYGANDEKTFVYPFTSVLEKDVLVEPIQKDQKLILKEELGIKEGKMILTIGRFIHSKGFDTLLKACRNLPNEYAVYIVGGEPTKEYLELIEKLNLTNIHFVGFKSKKVLREYYMASDLFVLPTREDIWGLVINEAMSFGLPVITTDKCVAGLELINDYENGFIIPVNDEVILHKKIQELMSNGILLDTISKNNLEKISNYTIEQMALEHMNIFKQMLLTKER
ncbi:glycosyltransferase family 4 protein [Clostridium algidicarnis]|nr:glycosyltransferase family 4 protein [Clostridium algidicarnis]